jgi:CDP-diacylglycerol--glycerol-3-phosphate 3-phosphatidyltransferase
VKYENTPPWYLLVGLARYMFVIGLWWRERKGLKTYPLPPSTRRRLLAGTQMGLLAILLLPAFKPPGTIWAVAAFGLPLLAGFVWDWFLAIGKIEESDASFQRETLLVRWAGFGVRWMAVGLAHFTVLSAGGTLETNPLMGILLLITAVMIATGILGRVSAFGGLMLLGMLQAQGSLDGVQLLLLLSFCGVLMLGCGPFSLLPLEEPLVYGRIGD